MTSPVTFAAPAGLACAAVALVAAVAVAWVRRPAVPTLTYVLAGVGGALLALAAGAPAWMRPGGDRILVMVDLSPSTRTAQYRDADSLRARIEQLLPPGRYDVVTFSGAEAGQAVLPVPDGSTLGDRPANATVFAPPPGRPVVLFSDGRFEIPAVVPPVYVVVDPALESPGDAAVERLELRGDDAVVTTQNAGGPRELTLSGVDGTGTVPVPPGPLVILRPLATSARPPVIMARLNAGDAWPENDALSLSPPPPAETERWWVGAAPRPSSAGGAWRFLRPSELPADASAYLAPSVVVLDNLAADDLAAAQVQRLTQYVRDLGGGLVIIGGDHAFAAGGYAGTSLESLSPLASTPPEPESRWVLLVDSSGSMNTPASGGSGATRWRVAAEAAAALLRSVPPEDRVSVGGFSAGISWWTLDRRAADAVGESLPPAGAAAAGPTELRKALADVTADAAAALPTHLVLFTDANASINDVDALADAMRRKSVRLHLLAIGDAGDGPPGLRAARQLVAATGGSLVEEADPARWAAAARRLLRRAAPTLLESRPIRVRFAADLATLPPRDVSPWNRTWLKSGATRLGEAMPSTGARDSSPTGDEAAAARPPLVARWQVGEGTVAAVAFASPRAAEVDAVLRLAARPPRDPRFGVTWDAGERLRVTVDAVQAGRYLNGLDVSLQLTEPGHPGAPPEPTRIPQTAPGRYELAVAAPRAAVVATVRRGAVAIDRVVVAGRYPAEFSAVGNDRAGMRELARRGGGAVVEPSSTGRLDLARPRTKVPLTAPLAAAGAACVALGLIRWKAS